MFETSRVRVGLLNLTESVIKTLQIRISELGQQGVEVTILTYRHLLSLTELILQVLDLLILILKSLLRLLHTLLKLLPHLL